MKDAEEKYTKEKRFCSEKEEHFWLSRIVQSISSKSSNSSLAD
jgi:hypothetical protein